jgi:catechol 2,3-dioxygenase-like lactoylglutathione lyase family enzyme
LPLGGARAKVVGNACAQSLGQRAIGLVFGGAFQPIAFKPDRHSPRLQVDSLHETRGHEELTPVEAESPIDDDETPGAPGISAHHTSNRPVLGLDLESREVDRRHAVIAKRPHLARHFHHSLRIFGTRSRFPLRGLGNERLGSLSAICELRATSTVNVRLVVRTVRLDHAVIAVSDWQISNRFYRDVVGAELVPIEPGRVSYRLGDTQLNVHGPGVDVSSNVARLPVQPGNSDLCFVWPGTIDDAVAHLEQQGVEVETGPVERFGAQGPGTSVYFRDPDGSLLEFISYAGGTAV